MLVFQLSKRTSIFVHRTIEDSIMRAILKISGFVALLVAFTVPMFAQADMAAQPKEEKAYSCFKLVGDSNFSFGVVDQNESVEHTFVFKNDCDEIIMIDAARASCGCTAAVLSEKEIQPGGEAKINVKFTPPRLSSGKVTKTVSLYIQGDSRPHTVIRFNADVKTDLKLEPRHISLRGAVVGKAISGKATLENMTDAPIEVSDPQISMHSYADTSTAGTRPAVAIPLENVTVVPSEFTLEPHTSVDIIVTLTPAYKGQINGNIRFKSGKSETWLQVYGIVRNETNEEIRK
jgi:Protein of unknown function (DUF1573)